MEKDKRKLIIYQAKNGAIEFRGDFDAQIIMKITICGSIAFYDEMLNIKKRLEQLGHQVKLPIKENKRKLKMNNMNLVCDKKEMAIKLHFQKVEWCDAILILNYDKNNISNYIGGNTLLELGLAFYLNKKLFLLNEIPEVSYKEEILGMKPIIINNDLSKIK